MNPLVFWSTLWTAKWPLHWQVGLSREIQTLDLGGAIQSGIVPGLCHEGREGKLHGIVGDLCSGDFQRCGSSPASSRFGK